MKKNNCLKAVNVSRETTELLNKFVVLLKKWNRSINLVSQSSISNIWERHILDSAQLGSFLRFDKQTWVDFGSGAGFPGIVIAVIAKTNFPRVRVILIESDQRKAVFLREVSRELNLNVLTLSERIEDCPRLNADIISARALAPLKKLLVYFDVHSKIGCKGLFIKGKNVGSELNQVKVYDKFNIEIKPNIVNSDGFIIEVDKKRKF